MNDANENATATMEMENEAMGGDDMQAEVNEAAMEAGDDNGMSGVDAAEMPMEAGGEVTKWLMYAVILIVALGALWYLFLR